MNQYKELQAKKRELLLAEARELLKGKTYAKPSYLLKHMKITGAMGASLIRSLGFVKYNKRAWKRQEI